VKIDWEIVVHDEGAGSGRAVRRLAVPGGWLYQVSMDNLSVTTSEDGWATRQHGWSAPVFVPDAGRTRDAEDPTP
jgi:hypothetical protein